MTDGKPRHVATDAITRLAAATADLAGATQGLDPRLVLAPGAERERLRCEQVLRDRYREVAALIPRFEAQLTAAEPLYVARVQAARKATVTAQEAWSSACAAQKHEEDDANATLDGLRQALGMLRPVVTATAREFGDLVTEDHPQGVA